ncbi:hypothetical protein [Staphylospora marina]|uniref:hypothetical protein n=1 Tax=Staphylospora marina TaxID=2490858 RepID=UPI0013DE6770|nr:hypothetical protein [Staphylospora marina]
MKGIGFKFKWRTIIIWGMLFLIRLGIWQWIRQVLMRAVAGRFLRPIPGVPLLR